MKAFVFRNVYFAYPLAMCLSLAVMAATPEPSMPAKGKPVEVRLSIADPCLNSKHQAQKVCDDKAVYKTRELTKMLLPVDQLGNPISTYAEPYRVVTTDYF